MFAFLLDLPTSHLCVEIAANAEQIYILVPEPGNLNNKTSIEIFFQKIYFLFIIIIIIIIYILVPQQPRNLTDFH